MCIKTKARGGGGKARDEEQRIGGVHTVNETEIGVQETKNK